MNLKFSLVISLILLSSISALRFKSRSPLSDRELRTLYKNSVNQKQNLAQTKNKFFWRWITGQHHEDIRKRRERMLEAKGKEIAEKADKAEKEHQLALAHAATKRAIAERNRFIVEDTREDKLADQSIDRKRRNKRRRAREEERNNYLDDLEHQHDVEDESTESIRGVRRSTIHLGTPLINHVHGHQIIAKAISN